MTILLVHNFYKYPGGEDTYFLLLKDLLKKKGHKVITYTKSNKSLATLIDYEKAFLKLFWNPAVDKEFERLLVKTKPDIVHFQNIFPLIGPGVYKICKKRRIKAVQTIHNYRFICPGAFMYSNGKLCIHNNTNANIIRKMFSKCYRNSRILTALISLSTFYHRLNKTYDNVDTFIFPSMFTKGIYSKLFTTPKNKTFTIPYFVLHPKRFPKLQTRDYFLFVGRFSEEKGIRELLEVASKYTDIKFIFIGSGPLKEYADRFKIYKNITIMSHLSHKKIYAYMQNAIATVIPSRGFETGPIVAIESFVNGTRSLTSNIGVFKELKKSLRTIIYNSGDTNSLKSKLQYIYKKRRVFNNIDSKNKNKYLTDYHYKLLLEVYNKQSFKE